MEQRYPKSFYSMGNSSRYETSMPKMPLRNIDYIFIVAFVLIILAILYNA